MVRKMTKAEAGKLGAIRTHEILKIKQGKLINVYNKNPITCKLCTTPIPYDKRKVNVYCSSSCAAKVNNVGRVRNPNGMRRVGEHTKWECGFCGKCHVTVKSAVGKYCSNICQQEHAYHKRIKNWVNNEVTTQTTPSYARRYLTESHGHECNMCGITEWNGNPIVFDIDHIDGNPTNHNHTNLRLICQNCHGQTPNYKAKNKGNGRHYRVKRYTDGKSY